MTYSQAQQTALNNVASLTAQEATDAQFFQELLSMIFVKKRLMEHKQHGKATSAAEMLQQALTAAPAPVLQSSLPSVIQRTTKQAQAAKPAAPSKTKPSKAAFKNLLQRGDVVIVEGTRDGHGLRVITKVSGDTIYCQQVSPIANIGAEYSFIGQSLTAMDVKKRTKIASIETRHHYSKLKFWLNPATSTLQVPWSK